MREHFYALIELLADDCAPGTQLHATLAGEDSDFIRFNQHRVRQAGHVSQHSMQLSLVDHDRHCHGQCELSGNPDSDSLEARALLEQLRHLLASTPPDPYLNYNQTPLSGENIRTAELPGIDSITNDVVRAAADMDLVGIYAAGDIQRGYANSLGQRNWHSRTNFNLDWSCHTDHGAAKSHYAGSHWDSAELNKLLQSQRQALALMQNSPNKPSPGRYRAYLAPTAVAELITLLAADGFSIREQRSRQSPLLQLFDGRRQFSPLVSMTENRTSGLAPLFSDEGFALPQTLDLVDQGRAGTAMVDARSAREYDLAVNSDSEAPAALEIGPGDLVSDDILRALDTGLYINHLWYANFSDINNCRITGMTRYACFWVENGRMQSPLEVMRFDDSLYRLLGEDLEALTAERRLLHDPDSYEQRSLDCMHLPGVLCRALTLTL